MITQSPFYFEKSRELWDWASHAKDFIDDFGPKTYEEFEPELWNRIRNEMTWSVLDAQTPQITADKTVGFVGAQRVNAVSVQIKGLIINPTYRGLGLGLGALDLVVRELKGVRGYKKVMASCFATNSVMITLFRKLNAVREGTLSGVTVVDGKPADLILWNL